MEKIEWGKLTDEEYRELYRCWMNDPANSMKCSECPHGKDKFNGLPCGQQNCWVDATCQILGGC